MTKQKLYIRPPYDTEIFVKAIIRKDMKDGPCAYFSKGGRLHKMGDGFIKPLKVRNISSLLCNWSTQPIFVECHEQLLVHGMEQEEWGQEGFFVNLKHIPKKWWPKSVIEEMKGIYL